MQRIPWWGLVATMLLALVVIWFSGRMLAQRYKARWPW